MDHTRPKIKIALPSCSTLISIAFPAMKYFNFNQPQARADAVDSPINGRAGGPGILLINFTILDRFEL